MAKVTAQNLPPPAKEVTFGAEFDTQHQGITGRNLKSFYRITQFFARLFGRSFAFDGQEVLLDAKSKQSIRNYIERNTGQKIGEFESVRRVLGHYMQAHKAMAGLDAAQPIEVNVKDFEATLQWIGLARKDVKAVEKSIASNIKGKVISVKREDLVSALMKYKDSLYPKTRYDAKFVEEIRKKLVLPQAAVAQAKPAEPPMPAPPPPLPPQPTLKDAEQKLRKSLDLLVKEAYGVEFEKGKSFLMHSLGQYKGRTAHDNVALVENYNFLKTHSLKAEEIAPRIDVIEALIIKAFTQQAVPIPDSMVERIQEVKGHLHAYAALEKASAGTKVHETSLIATEQEIEKRKECRAALSNLIEEFENLPNKPKDSLWKSEQNELTLIKNRHRYHLEGLTLDATKAEELIKKALYKNGYGTIEQMGEDVVEEHDLISFLRAHHIFKEKAREAIF